MNKFISLGAWLKCKLIEYCHDDGRFDVQASMFSCKRCSDRSSAACSPDGVPTNVSVTSASDKTWQSISHTRFTQQNTQLSKLGQEAEAGKDRTGFPSCIPVAYPIGVITRKWSIAVGKAYRESSTRSQCLPTWSEYHRVEAYHLSMATQAPHTLKRRFS